MLEAGFTTVRDVGNEGEFACTSLRRAVSAGLVDGPTIINAGRIIAPYGGQFQLQPDKGEVLASPEASRSRPTPGPRRGRTTRRPPASHPWST
jgi:hypothetical protein